MFTTIYDFVNIFLFLLFSYFFFRNSVKRHKLFLQFKNLMEFFMSLVHTFLTIYTYTDTDTETVCIIITRTFEMSCASFDSLPLSDLNVCINNSFTYLQQKVISLCRYISVQLKMKQQQTRIWIYIK